MVFYSQTHPQKLKPPRKTASLLTPHMVDELCSPSLHVQGTRCPMYPILVWYDVQTSPDKDRETSAPQGLRTVRASGYAPGVEPDTTSLSQWTKMAPCPV